MLLGHTLFGMYQLGIEEEQWGYSNTQIPFTYPIAFPNSALCATSMHHGASTSVIHVINGLTSTSANIITNASTDYAQYVFVIGY